LHVNAANCLLVEHTKFAPHILLTAQLECATMKRVATLHSQKGQDQCQLFCLLPNLVEDCHNLFSKTLVWGALLWLQWHRLFDCQRIQLKFNV